MIELQNKQKGLVKGIEHLFLEAACGVQRTRVPGSYKAVNVFVIFQLHIYG